uniref:CBS domain-containing protein n=1 Tax=Gongylonema pulchrum TaxID=637853 RepID=A0A183DTY6_9BILA
LDILLHKGVSGVPVVEHKTFRVVDMYSRFDAIGVALEDKMDDLNVTVQEALAFRNTFRGLISLSDVINYLVVRTAEKLPVESPHHSRLGLHSQHSSLSTLREGRELITDSRDSSNSFTLVSGNDVSEKSRIESLDVLDERHSASRLRKQFAAFSVD